ncbi:pentatricopeptide repeat-containing protein At4g31070, mitochondrial [Argentina anserina]|uniref:pentatricopeptide repeat-containing protein At4g31070, mitochondrial n=1 Tax=Argentina anserina TaxID=57926 RepID=UPI0021766B37|nr:pentatricopeptide repeat-containing protein At4g31070, mitochondrial [Potentilla anserina]
MRYADDRVMRRLVTSGLNIKIKDLVSKGLYHQTLQVYKDELHSYGLRANTSILPSIIKACSSHHGHGLGLQLHCMSLKSGSNSDSVVSNSLISLYAKLALVGAARQVFDEMPERDVITWNSIINCYIQNGHLKNALDVLKQMYFNGFTLKSELIASIVSVCARTRKYRLARQIHGLVVADHKINEESVFFSTALLDLYMRCHQTSMAFHVFYNMEVKNEVSWTAMISGCIANHSYGMAINCFREMQVQGLKPNRVTILAILPACTELGNIRCGKELHAYSFRHAFESDPHCSAAFIHMYCKCGKFLRPAKLIFDKVSLKDVVMWSSMIGSYSECGDSVKALKLFSQMRAEGVDPNSVTILAIISACTSLSSLQIGCGVHSYVLKSGLNSDVFTGNALINMYAKCGCLMDSYEIFKEMPSTDSVSWSTMIESYGLYGCGNEALKLFLEMQDRRIETDAISFLSILSACNHAGLVEEGKKIFKQMLDDSRITLNVEHYACYVNLLGKFGKLEDACEIVRSMPMKPSSRIWSSLVTACRAHGRFEMAESLAHRLVRKEPQNAANYTLLSMVHAEAGNWSGVEGVRRAMRVQKLRKCYGLSRI